MRTRSPHGNRFPGIRVFWITVLAYVLLAQLPLTANEESVVDKYSGIFLKNTLFDDFQLSPDASHLSMILHKDSGDVMATMDLRSGKAHSASGRSGQRIYRYDWVDTDTLAFQVSLWDYYNAGLYLADENLKKFTLIGTPDVDQRLGLVFSKEQVFLIDPLPQVMGKMLLLDKTIDPQYPEAYIYNHIEGEVADRLKNRNKIVTWKCDLEGKIRLLTRLTEPGEEEFFHRKNEESEWIRVPLPSYTDVLGFDKSGDRIFVSYPDDSGKINFQIFDLKKMANSGKAVSHPLFSSKPALLREVSTGSLVGVVYNWAKPKVVYFDPTYRALHKQLQAAFPDSICQILGQTQKETILIKVSSDVRPIRIFELEPGQMTMNVILDQADWISEEICQSMEPIHFTARDGTEVHGYLTRARSSPEQTGPTVMYIHGGPKSRDSWGYDPMVQFLSNLGYHVIQVNYRGSSGFNEPYSIQELPRICKLTTRDIADAARWAVSEGIADKERIAIFGGSFGGYAALAGAAFEPELYKVAIGFAGVYDYDRQLKDSYRKKSSWREWLEPYIGDISENPKVYNDLSPVNFANQIKAKVLLIHGAADSRVSISQCRIMAKALRKAGKEPTVETSAWGIHGFADENKRIEHGKLVGHFLKKNL